VVGEGLGVRRIGEQNVRKLIDIVEGAKDGKMPTHDECYWAMLALSHLHYFEVSDIRTLTKSEDSARVRMTTEEGFRRRKMAMDKSPKDWVGWSHDPSNPEYQKMRATAFKVFEKATGESLKT
jgi:hypothetical protein